MSFDTINPAIVPNKTTASPQELLQSAEATKAIAALRGKLLDRSNRNRLLNFSHSPRSRGQVRIIDEIPAFLFSELQKSGQFVFKGLPEPDEENSPPEDETTDDFTAALERAQVEDQEFLDRSEKLSKQYDSDEDDEGFLRADAKLDRWLRNRIRKELGMPDTEQAPPDPVSIARENGIEPRYELPDLPLSTAKPSHLDSYLQTLLFPDELERKLGGVYEAAVHSLNEKGVNTLYLAFGFLEWFESDDSDKPLFAPLVLLPLEIEKSVEKGQIDFTFTANGEEAQTNISLAQRLKEDFGLLLPELKEDEEPETYFQRVSAVVLDKDRWRIRRFVTLGHFAFARLVMYNDLDETKWPLDRRPSFHKVARRLFGGGEASAPGGFREVYNPDDDHHEESAPPLIVDADSSQFSAVIDVIGGNNLVIQGPPGTGKSQTITNIIAAALNKGQTVLFVAEKMAALNVVMSRLENAGLGNFCLELHSTKAKKTAVIEAIRKRLDARAPFYDPQYARRAAKELREAKNKIRHYLQLLQPELGQTQFKVSQVLWKAHEKPEAQLPEVLRGIEIAEVEKWTPLKVDQIQRYFKELADAEAGLGCSPTVCPLSWISSASLTPINFPIIKSRIDHLIELLRQQIEGAGKVSLALGISAPDRWQQLKALTSNLGDLPSLADELETQAFEALSSPHNLKHAARFTDLKSRLLILRRDLDNVFPAGFNPSPESSDLLEKAVTEILARPCGRTLADVYGKMEQLRLEAADLDKVTTLFSRIFRALHTTPSKIDAHALRQAIEYQQLVELTPDTVLEDRSPARVAESAQSVFNELTLRTHTLQKKTPRIANRLKCEPATLEHAVVKLHRANLERRGLSGFLFSDYRAAKRFAARLYLEGKMPPKGEVLVDLASLETFTKQRDEFFGSSEFLSMFGNWSSGFETPFDRIKNVIDWAQRVRRTFRDSTSLSDKLCAFLLETPNGEVSKLAELIGEASAVLERVLRGSVQELDALDTAPARLRNEADYLEALLRVPEQLGLQRGVALETLQGTVALCREWSTSSTELASLSEQLAIAFGSTDVPRLLNRACQLRAQIEMSPLAANAKVKLLARSGALLLSSAKADAEEIGSLLLRYAETSNDLIQLAASKGVKWESAGFEQLLEKMRQSKANIAMLVDWCSWLRVHAALKDETPQSLLKVLDLGTPASVIAEHFRHLTYRAMARRAHEVYPALCKFSGVSLSEAQDRIRKIDAKLKDYARAEVIGSTTERGRQAPAGNGYGSVKKFTEMSLVNHETGKKSRHIPLRDLFARSGEAIQCLKPCFMMSPLSVAQFLRNDGLKFDIVIFDEASQVLPEDALGAMLRGDRLVVVGDQMQLPPTDFFQRADVESADALNDEESAAIHGLESILDKTLSVFQPARRLLWHYRSKDPRLIAYSNREFYDNALQLFPAADFGDPKHGVKVVEVGGTYSGRCNAKEADAIAVAAVAFMRRYPNRSLGIVALNGQQRDLIQSNVDRLISEDDRATEYRRSFNSGLEPFFVKNLENVQGDERDVIFISTVFGRDAQGNVFQRFGPINSAVGHRRLNVLFTRAKESVVVFTSLKTEDIQLEDGSSRGRHVLRGYLEYARTGRLEAGTTSGRPPDSDFEELVRSRLKREGYEVDCQVGVAGYFVDLAVKHPQRPTSYVLAVECDGATYHSFKSARDRDRLRHEILERLGWKIHRIWSTDWFQNPEHEMVKLLDRLKSEVQVARADVQEHLDYSAFEGPSTPAKRSRPRPVEQTKLKLSAADATRVPAPKIEEGELSRFISSLRQRTSPNVFLAFEQSVDFAKGTPIQVQLESTRLGIHRRLELEEAYNRAAFRWASSSSGHSLFRMPWASNLSAEENFKMREFAISALVKAGRLS